MIYEDGDMVLVGEHIYMILTHYETTGIYYGISDIGRFFHFTQDQILADRTASKWCGSSHHLLCLERKWDYLKRKDPSSCFRRCKQCREMKRINYEMKEICLVCAAKNEKFAELNYVDLSKSVIIKSE